VKSAGGWPACGHTDRSFEEIGKNVALCGRLAAEMETVAASIRRALGRR